jgi:hypothetical protein
MRLFKRKPKKCETISFVYNYLKPEDGINIYLGVDKHRPLYGFSRREIAYHHIEVDDIDWLIIRLHDIQNQYRQRGY